jgi:pyruvate dehydrogenase E2 component (dihydrolipoamide acetyltransferase)
MAEVKEARVPDIGNFDGVPVIEVLVKPGDTVRKDQGLITLESDKATMEVPAPFAGTVKEVKVKEGDEVAEGALIALIEADAAEAPAKSEVPKAPDSPAPAARPHPPSAPSPASGGRKQPALSS